MTIRTVDEVVESLREEALTRQTQAWGAMDGGQQFTLSAMLAEEAATLIEQLHNRVERLRENIVELWHEAPGATEPLEHYLDMTGDEYVRWVNPAALTGEHNG